MDRRLFTILGLVIALTLISGVDATARQGTRLVSLKRIFNAGLNLGWLVAASSTNMFPHLHRGYASNAAAEFNNAFYPMRAMGPPPTNSRDARDYLSKLESKLPRYGQDRRALQARNILLAGWNLGIAHVYAQHGRCPSCMTSAMQDAGRNLTAAGQGALIQSLHVLGNRLQREAWDARARVKSVAALQAYKSTLERAMADVRNAL